jgi:hypothetical protein
MDTFLNQVRDLCEQNSVQVCIWSGVELISWEELNRVIKGLKFMDHNTVILLFLSARIGSKWDYYPRTGFDTGRAWRISMTMITDLEFQSEFEQEFYARLLNNTFS